MCPAKATHKNTTPHLIEKILKDIIIQAGRVIINFLPQAVAEADKLEK
jgi:hypothetical protein